MRIQSSVVRRAPAPLPFPKLMIASSTTATTIVLFDCAERGMCVAIEGKNPQSVGWYSDSWDMEAFKDFHGDITITQ